MSALNCSARKFSRSSAEAVKIMIVDDHADAGEAVALFLSVIGFDTRLVKSSGDANVIAETFHPDVVLLDINMPGTNGFGVAKILRASEQTNQTILVAYTSEAWATIEQEAIASGFDGYFRKTSEASSLLNLLSSYASSKMPH